MQLRASPATDDEAEFAEAVAEREAALQALEGGA
jgi:hypothetical protein